MLVVLTAVPVAAPEEAVVDEALTAEVVLVDLVREVLGAVRVFG